MYLVVQTAVFLYIHVCITPASRTWLSRNSTTTKWPPRQKYTCEVFKVYCNLKFPFSLMYYCRILIVPFLLYEQALQVIHDHGLSAALFAPGWVYENQDKEHFFEHQDKFWTLLAPFCNTHPISSLPIVSSFSRGFGEHVTIDGEVSSYLLLLHDFQ